MEPSKLTVRVYGVLINDKNEVLLADENINGRLVTKFPGGGLEIGEGPADCVIREFREETGQEVSMVSHFYTTDFYIHSQINPDFQVVGIYYKVSCPACAYIETNIEKDNLLLKWVPVSSLKENDVTFDSDRAVVRLLLKERISQHSH